MAVHKKLELRILLFFNRVCFSYCNILRPRSWNTDRACFYATRLSIAGQILRIKAGSHDPIFGCDFYSNSKKFLM